MDDYRSFIGKVVREQSPVASPAELDALLHWLAGRSNKAAASVETAFNTHGISPEMARRHTLRYLDHSIFRHHGDYYELFGLAPNCSLSAIRARHRQLLQTLHPDRHTEDRDWFTKRTEQLNRAYAYLKKNHGKRRFETVSSRVDTGPAVGRKPRAASAPGKTRKQSFAAYKIRLRQKLKAYLGDPARFERRLYVFLFAVPLILLLFIYLNQVYLADHRKRTNPAGTGGSAGSPNTRTYTEFRDTDNVWNPVEVGIHRLE